jgi:hypothetical protein
VLQHLEESATLLIVNAVPIYNNNVWGVYIQKGGAKRKKKQGREHTLALSLYSDDSISSPIRLGAMEINNEVTSVQDRDHSDVTCHSHLVIAWAAIDGAVILG